MWLRSLGVRRRFPGSAWSPRQALHQATWAWSQATEEVARCPLPAPQTSRLLLNAPWVSPWMPFRCSVDAPFRGQHSHRPPQDVEPPPGGTRIESPLFDDSR
jgi:hypothetical protein